MPGKVVLNQKAICIATPLSSLPPWACVCVCASHVAEALQLFATPETEKPAAATATAETEAVGKV